ncbi:hypothetical protein [Pontibacter anaerobius]|uniref:Uncharacterized protein n=1 Tax=Pontibacter anaerobius TaxID=2993940 RepID=A0ABT3RFH0_9BACT|nr:hypothetical protein [Pontibacter anaerobius]MCX2740591.1 hypothetical protein [Pontibacter anaerobius]
MKVDICSLIKFGEKAHMESFYKKGIVFMNHLNAFRHIEDEELRGDKHEALYEQKEINNIKIYLGNNKLGVAEKGRFQLWNDNPKGNIFSMYALKTTEDLSDIKIDSACKKFGDACVLILDINEFISRVGKAAKRAGYELVYSPVEYIDLKRYHGKWSVFKKPIQYSYQSEFRFFIRREESEPLFLEIGSLEDIAAIAESDKIDTLKVTKV